MLWDPSERTTRLYRGILAVAHFKGAAGVSPFPLRDDPLLARRSLSRAGLSCPAVCKMSGRHDYKDPTKHDFWHSPGIGPWNQMVRSLRVCGFWGS